ncbi:MAG: aminotransferase class I/II-fold pyridoxal phosphate-dependent enzyme [bacterium]|nr:aminotransferase class I/II-fold pyridoxal phosphate-dependent enzyme [bacterium]
MLSEILKSKGYTPTVPINPDLDFIGTESSFSFGEEVNAVDATKKFPVVYRFHIGDTGPTTPQPIIDTAIAALKDKQTKYAPFLGYPSVRANIAAYLSKTRHTTITADNVMLMPGGKPAIELSMQALLGPEDWVVGQNPAFPIYESLAKFYGRGRYLPWLARKTEQGIDFEVADLEAILTSGKSIKLLVINTPQNPTGTILSRAKIERIARLARQYKFMVLFDDIYSLISFGDEPHFSMLSVPGMLDYTINLNGWSKDYAMTGWRFGYVVAPVWLIEIFGILAINKWSCVNRINQIAGGVVFGDVEVNGKIYPSVADQVAAVVRSDVEVYKRKGRFLVSALRLLSPFVVVSEAEGAFYLLPDIHQILELSFVRDELSITTDKQFCRWLLYEQGFACLAGIDFGEGGRGHIRLSYAEDLEKHIIPGTKHLIRICNDLIKKSGLTPPLSDDKIESTLDELAQRFFPR